MIMKNKININKRIKQQDDNCFLKNRDNLNII